MLIDANSILQADATVIAGVLILLTIYSLKLPESIEQKRTQQIIAGAIIVTIVPFAISAGAIVSGDNPLAAFTPIHISTTDTPSYGNGLRRLHS
jgi:heme A synthase